MLKLLSVDTTGTVPYPDVTNPALVLLRGLKTLGGHSLDGKFPDLVLVAKDGYESQPGLCDYFKVGLLNVFSSKMKVALQSVGAELEFFPVVVQYGGKNTTTKYFVGNPLKRIKGIDKERSIVEFDAEIGDAISVEKLVLDESQFEGAKFSVIDEVHRIAVSEDVVAAVRNADCTGCMFVDASSLRY